MRVIAGRAKGHTASPGPVDSRPAQAHNRGEQAAGPRCRRDAFRLRGAALAEEACYGDDIADVHDPVRRDYWPDVSPGWRRRHRLPEHARDEHDVPDIRDSIVVQVWGQWR